jgi:hypothetical protein
MNKSKYLFLLFGNICVIAGAHWLLYDESMTFKHFGGFSLLLIAYNLLFLANYKLAKNQTT